MFIENISSACYTNKHCCTLVQVHGVVTMLYSACSAVQVTSLLTDLKLLASLSIEEEHDRAYYNAAWHHYSKVRPKSNGNALTPGFMHAH